MLYYLYISRYSFKQEKKYANESLKFIWWFYFKIIINELKLINIVLYYLIVWTFVWKIWTCCCKKANFQISKIVLNYYIINYIIQ